MPGCNRGGTSSLPASWSRTAKLPPARDVEFTSTPLCGTSTLLQAPNVKKLASGCAVIQELTSNGWQHGSHRANAGDPV